jgi:signal peptidase II
VFNVADSSISIGIFSIILFYRKQFNNLDKKSEEGTVKEQEQEAVQQTARENETEQITKV